jgi:hypothetical protein
MQYRSFLIRQRPNGQWQGSRPTDMTWDDGLSAPTRKELKAAIDHFWENYYANQQRGLG